MMDQQFLSQHLSLDPIATEESYMLQQHAAQGWARVKHSSDLIGQYATQMTQTGLLSSDETERMWRISCSLLQEVKDLQECTVPFLPQDVSLNAHPNYSIPVSPMHYSSPSVLTPLTLSDKHNRMQPIAPAPVPGQAPYNFVNVGALQVNPAYVYAGQGLVVQHNNPEYLPPRAPPNPPRKKVTSPSPNQQRRRGRIPINKSNLVCQKCGTNDTPEWRRGPAGSNTLCNACGLQYAKKIKKEKESNSKAMGAPNSTSTPTSQGLVSHSNELMMTALAPPTKQPHLNLTLKSLPLS